MSGYVVARLKDGEPFDWLHSVAVDGSRHMLCTNPKGAMKFASRDEAADAAGECMDRWPEEEYRADHYA